MKITYSILGLAAGAALFLANGCGKEEQPSGETPKVTPPVASDRQKAAEAPKPATEPAPAAAAAATAASQTVSAGASDAQKAVDAQKAAVEQMPSAAAASQAAGAATSDAQKAVGTQKAAAPPVRPSAAAAGLQAFSAAAGQTSAVAAVASTLSTTNSLVDGLIYNAKGLVTNQKYQDALNVVQQLSSMKLTPEQQKVVDGLKTQIQTALAKAAGADAASALGNVLGGKK